MKLRNTVKKIVAISAFLTLTTSCFAEQVEFAVLGDMPYRTHENVSLTGPDGEIFSAIKALNPPVLVHYGDFKAGGESCTDDLITTYKNQIANLNPGRTVYTPGDNDWTDCDRPSMSVQFDEMERLELIRNLFFGTTGLEMSKDIPGLVRQENFPENAIWKLDNLVMGTLHIVGTNNGREEILKSDVNKTLDAVDSRDTANEIWLQKMFSDAQSAAGLVVLFQSDIYEPGADKKPACTKENRVDCDGYKNIRDAIAKMAAEYKKPVLAVHGDTNAYCFNQQSETISNLWHLNGPGDYKVIDAAKITFDAKNSAKPFEVVGLLDPKAPPEICDYSR
ncbi:hypothetical protein QUF74_15745 [Candidatus Halobeggiatoa sp. HSG11]|nr:hypothetical protein [Candidatus Halobeggiatoa sp. HSG11]